MGHGECSSSKVWKLQRGILGASVEPAGEGMAYSTRIRAETTEQARDGARSGRWYTLRGDPGLVEDALVCQQFSI